MRDPSANSTSYQNSQPLYSKLSMEEGTERKVFPSLETARGRRKRMLILLAVGIGAFLVFFLHWHQPDNSLPVVHKAAIPTLLSVVDHETNTYLYALDNPLYDELKTVRLIDDTNEFKKKIRSFPEIQLDRLSITKPDSSLTVSWTQGAYETDDEPVVTDDSLLVLRCGSSSNRTQIIYEVATIGQVRATHELHTGEAHPSSWFIPSFPFVRQEACQFFLYSNATTEDSKAYYLVAESYVLDLSASVTRPTGIHWSTTDSGLVVQFVTGATGTPVLRINDQTYTGTSDTYTSSDLCGAPANLTEPGKFLPSGQLHTVYYKYTEGQQIQPFLDYKVGLAHGQGTTWSDTFRFVLPVPAGSQEPFTFLAYGDQGCPNDGWGVGSLWVTALTAREVNNHTSPNQIRAIHHFGDLSYAQGAAHQWDAWMAMVQPFTTKIPMFIGVGNHEYDHTAGGGHGRDPSHVDTEGGYAPSWGNYLDDSGGECGVPVSKRFAMPKSKDSNGVFWYSFDFGSVHTTVISSEHDLSPGSPQYEWLAQDLQAVNRTRTPWLVVESHRPMYEGEEIWDQNAVTIGIRYNIEDLLVRHQVDVCLAGHYHAYHRTCDGLYKSKCDNGGPIHVTIGSAGASLDSADLYPNDWTARYIRQEYGYGKFTVANSTAMLIQFIKAGDEQDPEVGLVRDEFWVLRERQI